MTHSNGTCECVRVIERERECTGFDAYVSLRDQIAWGKSEIVTRTCVCVYIWSMNQCNSPGMSHLYTFNTVQYTLLMFFMHLNEYFQSSAWMATSIHPRHGIILPILCMHVPYLLLLSFTPYLQCVHKSSSHITSCLFRPDFGWSGWPLGVITARQLDWLTDIGW